MKNYYALLGTHLLTDNATLIRLIAHKEETQSLDSQIIKEMKALFFDESNKQKYDKALQLKYPELLNIAQQIQLKSKQRIIAKKSIIDDNKWNTPFYAPSKKFNSINKLNALLLTAILLSVLICASYFVSNNNNLTSYHTLNIMTAYKTNLHPNFKKQLELITTNNQNSKQNKQNKQKQINDTTKIKYVEFNEELGILIIYSADNRFAQAVYANSEWAIDNKYNRDIPKTNVKSNWSRNNGFNVEPIFWRIDNGGQWQQYDYPDVKQIFPARSLIAPSGDFVVSQPLLSKQRNSLMFFNAHRTEQTKDLTVTNCCSYANIYFNKNESMMLLTSPLSTSTTLTDNVVSLQKNANKNISSFSHIAQINQTDRIGIKKSDSTTLIDTVTGHFYDDILVTLSNHGNLRYWKLPTSKVDKTEMVNKTQEIKKTAKADKTEMIYEAEIDYNRKWRATFSSDGRYLWYPSDKGVNALDMQSGMNQLVSQDKHTKNKKQPTAHAIGNKALWLINHNNEKSHVYEVTN